MQVDLCSSLAPGFPEDPVAHDLLGEAEGHDDEAEGEVGDGQRGHEPVLLRVERGLVEDWGVVIQQEMFQIKNKLGFGVT